MSDKATISGADAPVAWELSGLPPGRITLPVGWPNRADWMPKDAMMTIVNATVEITRADGTTVTFRPGEPYRLGEGDAITVISAPDTSLTLDLSPFTAIFGDDGEMGRS